MNNMLWVRKDSYQELLEAKALLVALRRAGVDNWEGYAVALELLKPIPPEEEW